MMSILTLHAHTYTRAARAAARRAGGRGALAARAAAAQMMAPALLLSLLPLLALGDAALPPQPQPPPQPSICLNATGFAFVSAAGCPAGATPFRHAGADAFNILWSVWNPTRPPHPPHTGNWSTSAATLEQLAAARLPFTRVFGSPWGWEQILLWRTATEQYWANMTRVVDKAKAVGAHLHLSITPTLSQFAIAAGCPSTRELITDEGDSGCRDVLKEYVQDMVGRFKDDATIVSWGMGNELNLEADGCSYNKSRGEYFSTAEMMAFSTLYISWVKELDPLRPMGSDMGQARTRASHLAALKGGGAACVNAHNLKGDCEVNCSAVPKDSLADFKQITKILSAPFDLVSVHDYGCYPPFAEFSFCNGDSTSIAALQAAKEVADETGKPLFVGEFGSPACNVAGGAGWDSEECLAFPRKLLDYQVKSGIQLSNAWTWCQDDAAGWCINDGKGAEKVLSLLQATDRKLNDDQRRALAKSDDTEALKTDDATAMMVHHLVSLNGVDTLISAKNAFRYARAHLVEPLPGSDRAGSDPAQEANNCGWGRSTYMVGLWEYYAATVAANAPDLAAKGDLADWGRRMDYELCKGDGTAWTGPCATGNLSGCANNQQAAAVYIELYKAGLDLPVPHAEATLRPIIAEFNAEIALGSVTEGSWPSVDLTMMAVAPLARLGALTGEPKYFEKLWANWNATMLTAEGPPRLEEGTIRPLRASYGLFNRSDKLFRQSDDNGASGANDGYWGRGNGWAMLSLVDAIRFGDTGAATRGGVADPHREKYIAVFRLFAGRLLGLQGDDGAWRSSLLETTKFPTRETTGTACFTRGLAYGINAGLLDARTYVPAVSKAWEFLSRSALQPSGRVGYCQNTPGRPTNDSASLNASTTSGYCVGLLLGAAAEVSRLADYVTEQAAADKQLHDHASPLPSLATDDEHGAVVGAPVEAAAAAAPVAPPALQMHWLGEETEARCMDGSRYGYYFRPASSASATKKWVIELQGGGWCYNEGACYGRTLPSYAGGGLGSSKNWTTTFGTYYLEDQDWNRVFLRYCSGASFTGYRKEGWDASGWPIPGHMPPNNLVPSGTKLWFRGAANLADSIADLQAKHGMKDVEELILTGSSAGGLATTLNLDRVKELVQPKRIAGLSDAGFFKYESNHSTPRWSGSANFSADMAHLYGMVNASGSLSAKCQAAQATQGSAVPAVGGKEIPPPGPYNCLVAATAEQYVESPIFFLQSRFDHFQLGSELALQCMVRQSYSPPWKDANCSGAEVAGIREYAADLHAELSRVISSHSSPAPRAIFLSACIIHGQQNLNAWTKTKILGVTPQQAWREWYGGLAANESSATATATWVEECADGLPCNPNALSCAPYS
jgi:hypothetical protein